MIHRSCLMRLHKAARAASAGDLPPRLVLPMPRLLALRCAMAATAFVGSALSAQSATGTGTVKGTVLSALGLPIVGAQVRLVVPNGGTSAAVESDENGGFAAARVPSGTVWLVAKRIGYRPDSVRVTVGGAEPTNATVRLERIAVELTTVKVLGRRDITGHLAGFYSRMGYGSGRFFTATDIERRNSTNLSDIFRMIPGLRIETRGFQNVVRMRGSRCAPLVWLDGQPLYAGEVDLDAFDARSFDGVEVYSGAASVPVEFQGNQRMSSACGTIILWSKRGELREKKRKKDEPTPTERITALLEGGSAFVVTDVDLTASPDSFNLVRPIYPDSLFEAQTPGRVLAEFIVSPSGEAVMETFSAVTTTHRLFVEPVRRAVRDQRFTPAFKRGKPVQQVMQLPFEFVPDSTARRRK
ncbi:carboxypeptidase regulatory-like domain-containing protein [Gemmatimonas sp.]|uniref:carboxypeptidase regulatory-like domain-containing protein n=1 Tax=Gemmatimonas sp. TaxID=1962908 RepID=UPI00333E581E